MERNYITITRHKVLLKKINSLIKYSNENNYKLPKKILNLIAFIQAHKNNRLNTPQVKELEQFTKYYKTVPVEVEAIKPAYLHVIASAYELIRYAKNSDIVISSYFLEDLENIQSVQEINEESRYICDNMRNYMQKVWRAEDSYEEIEKNTFYILRNHSRCKSKYEQLNKEFQENNFKLTTREQIIFNKISKTEFNIDIIIKEMMNRTLNSEQHGIYECINHVLFDNMKESGIKSILFNGRYKDIRNYIIKLIKTKLDEVTKDYKDSGTDESLTKEQKKDTLYNSYKLINQALKISNIPQQVADKITLLQNDILSTQRYQTELLHQLKENCLNQVSINSEGKRYYTNLYHFLVEYFELLSGLVVNLKELKYLDDGISAKYHILISDEDMAQWYMFYKDFAKDRYKSVALHQVYFSFLNNTENIQPTLYKKIFKTSKLQNDILPINTLPLTA